MSEIKQEVRAWNFQYRQELEDVLKKFEINRNNICLVGSIALSVRGLRPHGDIDFCTKTDIINKISGHLTGNYISKNVNLVVDKYERIGISDKELTDNSAYHEVIDGFKVIRIELEFSIKNCRSREKDIADIKLLEKHTVNSSNWNWSLVRDCIETLSSVGINTKNKEDLSSHRKQEMNNSRLFILWETGKRKTKKIIKCCLQVNFSPKKNYSWIVNKIKIYRLLESETITKYPTAKLISKNYSGKSFDRIDIIVRYLAIEDYFNKNEIGFSLYRKMQYNRLGFDNEDTEKQFKELIESFLEKGYDTYSNIFVNSKISLMNGSHRLALAAYFNILEVPIKFINPLKFKPIKSYAIEWFKENNFSDKEVDIIEQKRIEIFQKLGLFFYVILWPAAQYFFDAIEDKIRQEYSITYRQNLCFEDNDSFQSFVREIYAIDDIPKWKVERKIHAMKSYKKKIHILSLEIPEPKFRKKKINNHDISDIGAKLKAKYRSIYAKQIDNYVYDIIIHTGDNYESNAKITEILEKFINNCLAKESIISKS
ncbi:MAG: hypothetical protein WCD18_28070 [Thermosynechococcaceae cyanobacterium]